MGRAFYDVLFTGLFHKKSEPFDWWRNVNQNQIFFRLLSILNGLSYEYQIGLKLKRICSSFKKLFFDGVSQEAWRKLMSRLKFWSGVDSKNTKPSPISNEYFNWGCPKDYFKLPSI